MSYFWIRPVFEDIIQNKVGLLNHTLICVVSRVMLTDINYDTVTQPNRIIDNYLFGFNFDVSEKASQFGQCIALKSE